MAGVGFAILMTIAAAAALCSIAVYFNSSDTQRMIQSFRRDAITPGGGEAEAEAAAA